MKYSNPQVLFGLRFRYFWTRGPLFKCVSTSIQHKITHSLKTHSWTLAHFEILQSPGSFNEPYSPQWSCIAPHVTLLSSIVPFGPPWTLSWSPFDPNGPSQSTHAAFTTFTILEGFLSNQMALYNIFDQPQSYMVISA